jgi:hypothetical protein
MLISPPHVTSHNQNRAKIRLLFKAPEVSIVHSAESWTPERPALSWLQIYPCVGHAAPPPPLPTSPPHVRIVKEALGLGKKPLDAYIMVSILPQHPLVPPHPGFPPPYYHEYAHPAMTYTDGGLGKSDYTRFAQVYDPVRPWRGFILAPLPPTHPHIPLEQQNATSFFAFSGGKCYPLKGSWIVSHLRSLLERRAESEANFVTAATLSHRNLL